MKEEPELAEEPQEGRGRQSRGINKPEPLPRPKRAANQINGIARGRDELIDKGIRDRHEGFVARWIKAFHIHPHLRRSALHRQHRGAGSQTPRRKDDRFARDFARSNDEVPATLSVQGEPEIDTCWVLPSRQARGWATLEKAPNARRVIHRPRPWQRSSEY